MTLKKQTRRSAISDRELSQQLAGLREDVAAPVEFRAQLMQRLRSEGLIAGQPAAAPAEAGFWTRVAAALTPARLGLAATGALALALILRSLPTTTPQAQPEAAGLASVAVPAQAEAAVVAKAPKAKPARQAPVEVAKADPKAEGLPEAFIGDLQTLESVPAIGGSGAAASSSQVHSAALDPKPTVIVVEPSPTAVATPMQGNSELRGNVIRASEGGHALLIYRVQKLGRVHIEVFDRLGRSMGVLRDTEQGPGEYEIRWTGGVDAGGMAPSGIYVVQLETPGYNAQHKLLLVK
jgi:hypothetical protein